jgi:hypothetical protein
MHASAAALLVWCLIAVESTAGASAAVLPQARIEAAFASAKKLHRRSIPQTAQRWPYYKLDGSDAAGFVNEDTFDYGFLANGADVFIVPLISGGSGGVFSTLLFTAVGAKPRFVGVIPSGAGHLDVHIESGRIIVRTPIYGAGDPNCCPAGHHAITYTLVHGKLKQLQTYDTK